MKNLYEIKTIKDLRNTLLERKPPRPTVRSLKDFPIAIQKAQPGEKTTVSVPYSTKRRSGEDVSGTVWITFEKKLKPEYYSVSFIDTEPDDSGDVDYFPTAIGTPHFNQAIYDMIDHAKNMYGVEIDRKKFAGAR